MSKEPFSFGPIAAEYAALGLPVFQLKIKGKEAAVMNWKEVATTDPAVALKWWESESNRLFNVGVAMGHGIIAIDLDKPKTDGEQDGEESLLEYAAQHGGEIPSTWTFQTGRGGKQLLFRTDAPIGNFVGILPNVDVRGNGGYSMFPPSVHPNGNPYKWLDGLNPSAMPDGPADLPEFLLELLTKEESNAPAFELPDKISKGGRNDTLFRMAASLRAQEYTESEIFAMLKAVNEGRCDPPLPEKELETICGSVGKYERGIERSRKVKVPELNVQSVRDLQEEELPPIRWVVVDMIPQGLTMLASPPKYGKSWWVLDLCLSVAAGDKFMGHYTEKSNCLYLSLEDSKNRLQDRVNRLTYHAPAPKGFDYAITAANLDSGLIDQLEAYMKNHPKTALIVIDTLQTVKGNTKKNESAYADDYRQMRILKQFADKHSICVLLVHHLKKGKGEGDVFERISGTNGIFGSVDTALVMQKNTRGDKETTLHITGRDVIAEDMVLEFNKDSCRWECKGSVSLLVFSEGHALAQDLAGPEILIGGHLKQDRLEEMVVDFPILGQHTLIRISRGDLADEALKAGGLVGVVHRAGHGHGSLVNDGGAALPDGVVKHLALVLLVSADTAHIVGLLQHGLVHDVNG